MSKILAPFMPYLMGALVALGLGLGAYIWYLQKANERLTNENASLARSVEVLKKSKARAEQAREVADAAAERARERANEYDRLRESLLRGEDDAPLPDWFRDYLDELLGGVRND